MDISSSTVTITSFNGTNINDGTNYTAHFPVRTPLLSESDPVFVERADDFPLYAGLRLKEREFTVVIHVVAGTTDALKTLFDTTDKTEKKLLVTDSADSKAWYVYAVPVAFSVGGRPDSRIVTVKLSVADSIWRNNTPTTEDWTVAVSGGTNAWTVGGTKYAIPVITLTPKIARTEGFDYKRWTAIYNQTTRQFTSYPVNVLSGNIDHATLVGAGKAQADGDDWRWYNNGAEVFDKWVGGGGYNSATLRTWANINVAPQIKMTLGTGIAGAGAITTIDLQTTSANNLALRRLATQDNKVLYIGTEAFAYTAVDLFLYRVTGVTRSIKDTSAGAHSVGDSVYWLQDDPYLCYADSALTAPTADDNTKPILDLTNSTNTSWVYTDYYSKGTQRTAMWAPALISSTNAKFSPTPSGNYGATEATNTDFSAVASVMGMSIKAAFVTYWRSEAAEVEWRIYIPSGVTTVSTSGKKMRVSSSWPATAALQKSTDGLNWTTVWNEDTPSTTNTWEALASHASVALGATYQYLRYVFHGSVAGSASNAAHFEVDSITLTLDSAAIPSITLGAESSGYLVDATVKNDTTGDYIKIKYPAATATDIVIDCDNKTVTLADGTNMRAALTLSSIRKEWMTLTPGSNTISLTEAGLAEMDVDFTYSERSL